MKLNNLRRSIKCIFIIALISILISSCMNQHPDSMPEITKHFYDVNNLLIMHINNIENIDEKTISIDITANLDEEFVLDTSTILNAELYAYDNKTKKWNQIENKKIVRYYYYGEYDENGLYGSPILPTDKPLIIEPLPTAYYAHLTEDQIYDAVSPNMKVIVVDDNQKFWLDGKLYKIPGYQYKITYDVGLVRNNDFIIIVYGNLVENNVVTDNIVAAYEYFQIR